MKKVTDSEFSQVLAEIYIKASEDAAFRERLLKDSEGVLKEYNVEVPEEFAMELEKESRGGLPPVKALSDESLEGVAGGGLGDWIMGIFSDLHEGRDSKDDQKDIAKAIGSAFKALG